MDVIAYDPFLTEERAETLGLQMGTLDEVLAAGDFITVHTPLLKETRHIIDADAFDKMKQGARVINCARGGIIDEDALYDAIKSGKIAGAALDVFEEEPAVDQKVREVAEVITRPHVGGSTDKAHRR